tara:strand:+ start:8962 stop:9204 length:243 start_codon:yes stop_codon:yes gene_type:complete
MSWENILKGMRIEKHPRIAEYIDSVAKEMEFFNTRKIFIEVKDRVRNLTKRALVRYFKLNDNYIRDVTGQNTSEWIWVGE